MQLLHLTIQTAKFTEELDFYQNIIGLKIVNEMHAPGRAIVFLANAEGDTAIEIINNPDAEDAGNANLSIGFKTDDVAAKREELIAEGVHAKRQELIDKGFEATPVISPAPGVEFFFVKDPAGVSVQFI